MQPNQPTDPSAQENIATSAKQATQAENIETNQPVQSQPSPATPPQEQPVTPDQTTAQMQGGAEGQPPVPPPNPTGLKKKLIIAGIALFFLLVIGIIILLSLQNLAKKRASSSVTPTPKATVSNQIKPTSAPRKESNTLVYGAWTGQTSVIRAVDTATSTIATIATLPLTVRKISVMPDRNLLYIDQIDLLELGSRISIYNPKTKTITLSIPATSGYKIQDYVLSPNKKFIAIWEVSYAKGIKTLVGGQSRVYSVDLTNYTVKNLLYDENTFDKIRKSSLAIHYPNAILNNGTVFADKRVPSDTKGEIEWAHGLSVVDFDGENKRDIATMADRTYGTQPKLSSDGKYLVFGGYNGKTDSNATHLSILKPNSVDLLNTQSLQRFRLPNLPPADAYSLVEWDAQTGNVMISATSSLNGKTDTYAYNLGSQQATKITLPVNVARDTEVLAQLSQTKSLIGTESKNEAHIGNLGQTKTYEYTQIATLEEGSDPAYLSLQDPLIQYIAILPGKYFSNLLRE